MNVARRLRDGRQAVPSRNLGDSTVWRTATAPYRACTASRTEHICEASTRPMVARGIDFCAERDLDATRLYQTAWLAHARLLQGRWDEAAAAAHAVIAAPKATVIARIAALVALGRLRARRGDPGVWSALDEARDLAAGAGAGSFHVARAEAAWLEGRDRDAAQLAAANLPPAVAARQIALAAHLSRVPARWRPGNADSRLLRRAPVRPRSRGPLAGRGRCVAGARLPVRARARPVARRRAGATRRARHLRGTRRPADGRAGPASPADSGRSRPATRAAAVDASAAHRLGVVVADPTARSA